MPPTIWATPMARVKLGRLERPCIRLRQGLGPCFHALASALGRMRAMTPSPMRTIAAKCFARVGVVMSMLGKRRFVVRCVVCGAREVVARRRNAGVLRLAQDDDEKQGGGARKLSE
jgi:hypothetical protein